MLLRIKLDSRCLAGILHLPFLLIIVFKHVFEIVVKLWTAVLDKFSIDVLTAKLVWVIGHHHINDLITVDFEDVDADRITA